MFIVAVILATMVIVTALVPGCEKTVAPVPEEDIVALVETAGEPEQPEVSDTGITVLDTVESFEKLIDSTEYMECQTLEMRSSFSADEYPVFNPNAEVIWPGALLQGATIQQPTPERIIARRGSGKINIDNVTGSTTPSVTVDEVGMGTCLEAANKVIGSQPEDFPARLTVDYARVRTQQELAAKISASASFLGLFKSSAKFDWSEETDNTVVLVTLKQSFYTLVFERPSVMSDFFHPDVTADDLRPFVGPGNPPVYVSSVTYGRVFYLLIESSEEKDSVETAVSASFLGFGGSGKYRAVGELADVRIQAFALGGSAQAALDAVFGGLESTQSFVNSLKEGSAIGSAIPLSYCMRSVLSDRLVRNADAMTYSIKECVFPPANLSIVPNQIDFGLVRHSEGLVSRTVTLTNNGSVTGIGRIDASRCGNDICDGTAEVCMPVEPSGTFQLAPGESLELVIKFEAYQVGLCPDCIGFLECPITIEWNGALYEIPCTGTGKLF